MDISLAGWLFIGLFGVFFSVSFLAYLTVRCVIQAVGLARRPVKTSRPVTRFRCTPRQPLPEVVIRSDGDN